MILRGATTALGGAIHSCVALQLPCRCRRVLFFVGAGVDCTDVLRQLIGNHGGEFFLISVPDCLFIVPAFEFQHIQSAIHACDLRFHVGFPFLKHGLTLRICGRTLFTPIHELLDIPNLHSRLFQALNNPKRLNLGFTELTDTRFMFGKSPCLS